MANKARSKAVSELLKFLHQSEARRAMPKPVQAAPAQEQLDLSPDALEALSNLSGE